MKLILELFKVSNSQIQKTRNQYRNLSSETADWLLKVGQAFFNGYNATLSTKNFMELNQIASNVSDELRGFFYEGIGAGLTLKDFLRFWVRDEKKTYFYQFLNEFGFNYQEVLYVGMGMSYGRTRLSPNYRLTRIDQKYRRFLLDGYAFFKLAVDHIEPENIKIPKWLKQQDRNSYYLGLGRCLWFVESGDMKRILSGIKKMDQYFINPIWQGLGVSMTYAGKISDKNLQLVHEVVHENLEQLTHGSFTACEMRDRGSNYSEYSSFVHQNLSET